MKKNTAILGFFILLSLFFYNLPVDGYGKAGVQSGKGTPESVTSSGISSKPEKTEIPPVLITPSTVGEARFPHQMHYKEFGVECKLCHHEINAAALNLPHKKYFDDFWIDCVICHHNSGSAKLEAQSCSKCHHASPADIADETLSATVVIHKNCWGCHKIGIGAEASNNCKLCHMDTN